jgi:hypothetical protein
MHGCLHTNVGVCQQPCYRRLSAWLTDDLNDNIKLMHYDLQQALMLK